MHEIIEELTYGDTKLRLLRLESGVQYIQMWSTMTERWKNLYADNIDERWNHWKKMKEERDEQ